MRNFIRNWIKKIVAEAMRENFPPFAIEIMEGQDTENKVTLTGGYYVNSSIRISKRCKNKEFHCHKCYIDTTNQTFFKVEDQPGKEDSL